MYLKDRHHSLGCIEIINNQTQVVFAVSINIKLTLGFYKDQFGFIVLQMVVQLHVILVNRPK